MAAVFFYITIPTSTEEQRLKTEFIARKLDIPAEQVDANTLRSTTNSVNTNFSQDDRDDLSLQTLKLSHENGGDSDSAAPRYDTYPKRRKSEADTKLSSLFVREDGGDKSGDLKDGDGNGNGDMHTNDDVILSEQAKRKSLDGLRDILSSAKRKTTKRNDAGLDLPIDTAMEVVLRQILRKFQIENAIWALNTDGSKFQISFTVEFNEVYENLYDKLQEWGIGDREGSTVSVMNCIAAKAYSHKEDDEETLHDSSKENIYAQKQGAWDRFMNSVHARLNVTQIVRNVRQDAAINFDFVILLISAAILASFGLVEDSTIFLASSMLISPLMGPIIAAIFGTVIKERTLRMIGVRNELIGILVATLVGFIFGLVVGTTDDRYGIGEGLTKEMLSRCDLHSLVVGVFTAVPSGAAAAIGILGGNVGSLVGVAISASLLPPAVNSGLLWSLACIYKFFESDDSRYLYVVKSKIYSENQATELAILGTLSMCLTLSNVLCIYLMGILVLKVKEIAPIIARNNSRFWKYDIKLARDLTKNGLVSTTDAAIMDEFANLPKEDQHALGINYDFLRKLDDVTYQHTWSPLSNRHGSIIDNQLTIHRLEQMYTTITSPTAMQDKRRRRSSSSRRPNERILENPNLLRVMQENRPRFSSMPTANSPLKDVPEIVINASPIEATVPKRFVITPAAEDPLLKDRQY